MSSVSRGSCRGRGGHSHKGRVCFSPPSGFFCFFSLVQKQKVTAEQCLPFFFFPFFWPLCFQLVVQCQCIYLCVCVCVVVCLLFRCFFTTSSLPTLLHPTESSSPELRPVHLPTGGAGGAPLIMAGKHTEAGVTKGHRSHTSQTEMINSEKQAVNSTRGLTAPVPLLFLLGQTLLKCLYSSGGGRSSMGWKLNLDSKSSEEREKKEAQLEDFYSYS